MTDAAPASYRALALQTTCRAVNATSSVEEARRTMADSVERIGRQIRASKGFIGRDLRLVVLPEYVLTGFPMGETIEEWIDKACLAPGGPELTRLAELATEHDVWLCLNAYETDEHFPGLYFQACVIVGPGEGVVARYRRLNSMFAPTPHDVWTTYLDTYGLDGVFPVARTPLGNLAPVASEEILYPEIARAFALRGAEVLLHPTSETGSPADTLKSICRRARAVENQCYVVSANTAGVDGIDIPVASADGGSCVVDPQGRLLAEAGSGASMVAYAEIDVAAVRRLRRRPGMSNLLSRQRMEPTLAAYGEAKRYPADTLAGGPPDGRGHFVATQQAVIERLADEGLI